MDGQTNNTPFPRPHANLRRNLEEGIGKMESQLHALLERSFLLRFHALRLRQRVITAKLLMPVAGAPGETGRDPE